MLQVWISQKAHLTSLLSKIKQLKLLFSATPAIGVAFFMVLSKTSTNQVISRQTKIDATTIQMGHWLVYTQYYIDIIRSNRQNPTLGQHKARNAFGVGLANRRNALYHD